jgi:hypothetical protein
MRKHRSAVVSRRRISALVGALVLPLALAACGGSPASNTTTAGSVQTSTPAASVQTSSPAASVQTTKPTGSAAPASEAPLVDPCTLSTTDVVSSTFSVKANGPKATKDNVGDPECTWTWTDPVQGGCAVIIAPRPVSRFGKSKEGSDISGVGDAAYREPKNDQPNNVMARKGGSSVYIKMRCNADSTNGINGTRGFTTERQDTLNAFAKLVVAKL